MFRPHICGMERFELETDLVVTTDEGRVGLFGELKQDGATAMHQWFAAAGTIAAIDMHDFDIADGVACVQVVNLIRDILSRQEMLSIYGAPQVLAHNLYRIGLLVQGRIVLQAMREDEAFG